MKKLTLIRHAEAANPSFNQTDFDRSLTAHGQWQTVNMAKLLTKQGFQFDQMFSSSAQRALSTAHNIYDALSSHQQTITEEMQLYNIGIEQLYRFIEIIDDNINHAVIVAHNPGLSYLLNDLLREHAPSMVPCAVAQLQLNINDWIEVQTGCAQLISYDTPS